MYYVTYGFLYLLSLLPFWILYGMSDVMFLLIYYFNIYRKDVVMNNLRIAFPEKTEAERIKITREFYHNFLDNFFETIKLLSISNKQFYKKCTGNFDLIDRLVSQNKNIQIHSSHQFSWEYGNCFYAQHVSIPFVGVYMPLNNKIFDRIFLKLRTRFNTIPVDATKFASRMVNIYKGAYVLVLICDQNAGYRNRALWLNFFLKPAPFTPFPEKSAIRNNTAVVFARIKKIKRGHYNFENILITENASECREGELTKKYRDLLEESINQQPSNYLWSHNRWKYQYMPEYKKLLAD